MSPADPAASADAQQDTPHDSSSPRLPDPAASHHRIPVPTSHAASDPGPANHPTKKAAATPEFSHRYQQNPPILTPLMNVLDQRRQRRIHIPRTKLHRRSRIPVIHRDHMVVPAEITLQTILRSLHVYRYQPHARLSQAMRQQTALTPQRRPHNVRP